MTTLYALNPAEHATVLAALRGYQIELQRLGTVPSNLIDIATNCGAVTPLDDDQIDALCERLNLPSQIDIDAENESLIAISEIEDEPATRRAGDAITDEMLNVAANINDLDEALRSVMDQVGITTGDCAGIVFSGLEHPHATWQEMPLPDRFDKLCEWRASEQSWGDWAPTVPVLTPHDRSCGDLLTVDEFEQCRRTSGFIRSDGDGYWATAEGRSMDHSVWSTPKPDWATHVAWFNN
jgi:hypothetical protein